MIYVDTNVLVACINPRDKLHGRAVSLLSRYSGEELVVSQLVVLELYSVFSRVLGVDDVELEALVNHTIRKCGVKVVEVDWGKLYSQATRYAGKLRLRTLDLPHTIASRLAGPKTMNAFNKDINKKKNTIKEHLEIEVIGL